MKRTNLLALLAALLPCFSEAAVNVITTNFATEVRAPLTHPIVFGAVLAPAGQGTIAVGYFESTDAQISAAGANLAAWQAVAATFRQFGASVTMGTAAGNFPGLFVATPGVGNLGGTAFEGRNIYVAIGDAATLGASTFYAVFKSDTTFLAEPTPSVNAFLRDAAAGQPPAGTLLLGTYGPSSVYYATGPLAGQSLSAIVTAAPNPEPTAAMLGVLGLALGLIRRRSR